MDLFCRFFELEVAPESYDLVQHATEDALAYIHLHGHTLMEWKGLLCGAL